MVKIKMNPRRWLLLIILIVFFGSRIYVDMQQKQKSQEQEQMFRDLSRSQQEMRDSMNIQNLDEMMNSYFLDLDSTLKSLDSIGNELEKIGASLDSMKI